MRNLPMWRNWKKTCCLLTSFLDRGSFHNCFLDFNLKRYSAGLPIQKEVCEGAICRGELCIGQKCCQSDVAKNKIIDDSGDMDCCHSKNGLNSMHKTANTGFSVWLNCFSSLLKTTNITTQNFCYCKFCTMIALGKTGLEFSQRFAFTNDWT